MTLDLTPPGVFCFWLGLKRVAEHSLLVKKRVQFLFEFALHELCQNVFCSLVFMENPIDLLADGQLSCILR